MKQQDLLNCGARWHRVLLFAALLSAGFLSTFSHAAAQGQPKSCFPTCDERDGRFLSLAGTDLQTLAGETIEFGLRVPSNANALSLEIFDGETGGMWDRGTTPLRYRVYADEEGDGVDANDPLVADFIGTGMPDNAWYTRNIPTTEDARLSPAGPYTYALEVSFTQPYLPRTNSSFKIRANADILLTTRDFAFQAALTGLADKQVIYPSYPGLANSRYNGTWDFYLYVDKAAIFGARPDTGFIEIWDGDMDYGSFNCVQRDDDDANTPNAPFLPEWSIGTTVVPEGAATSISPCRDGSGNLLGGTASGSPPDDNLNPETRREPSVVIEVTSPTGQRWVNLNPSGNQEWERFRIGLGAQAAGSSDYVADSLPDGIYRVRVLGMDMDNLNFWHSNLQFIGVCQNGTACFPPPEPACTTNCTGVTATKGYWKNHTEAWCVSSMMIGNVQYNKATLLAWLSGTGTDKFNILASQLVAAKLSIACSGPNSSCINETIEEAEAWIAQNVSRRPISEGAIWNVAAPLAQELDAYNNGLMCAPHRDSGGNSGGGGNGGNGGGGNGGGKAKGKKIK